MRYVLFALPASALRERLAQLRWRFRKWDTHVRGKPTTAPGALVLTRREHEEAVRVAEELCAAAEVAIARWPMDHDITREMGVDPRLVPLARACATKSDRVTRVDLFLTEDGWRASELNDDVPGGYNDALGLAALFHDAVEKGAEIPGDLADALARLLAPEGARARVGLVYATAYAEDLQVVRLLADIIEASGGVDTVLASPAHLRFRDGVATLQGEKVDALYRFFPAEWFPLLENLGDWRAAAEAGVRIVNPFGAAWTQSKASFARLRHPSVPRTLPLTPEAADDIRREPERWVLKPAFGRMGEGVVLGAALGPKAWDKAIDGALRGGAPTVAQERFAPLRVETTAGASAIACVGAYVVNGRFAGYYSRMSEGKVVRFDATNVLTVLEAV